MESGPVKSADQGLGPAPSPPVRWLPRPALSAWLASLLLHAVLFLAMLALVFPYAPAAPVRETITRAELIGDPDGATSSLSPLSELPTHRSTPDATQPRIQPRQADPLSGLQSIKKRPVPIIGIGTGRSDFSRFGLGVGGGGGPEFFGLGGTARGVRRIVYVVDRSGSMLGTFDIVRRELKRSVNKLRRSQKFHVIFFNSKPPVENPPRRLVSAIQAHKQQLYEFLDRIMPDGGTDPAPAMRRAFATEPDLIYFLTDGEFDKTLLPKLGRWNEDRAVRIFTIAFFGAGGVDRLEKIAREHNGEFRFVTEDDLP